MLLLLGGLAASASFMGPAARTDASSQLARSRAAAPVAQFGFKVQKSERLLIREAWERADAYRPGKPNWFTQQPKDLVELHKTLLPELDLLTCHGGVVQPTAEGRALPFVLGTIH